MTIQDLGSIGELVSAIAILITLVYLAVQVKYARMATVDRNRETRVNGIIEINNRLANNPDLRQAFDKTTGDEWKIMLQDFASAWGVSVEEASAVFWTQSDFVWLHWAQYRSTKTIEDQNELENIVRFWYSAPPTSTMMENDTFRSIYDPDFIAWVDTILPTGDV
ncbi:MAG: hypothetical protein ACI9ON_002004 [Limisphaerales bacterium]|jgi:hypothetical protein